MMRRLPILLFVMSAGAFACDSLSDPSVGPDETPVARIQGALVGVAGQTVPSNAKVSVVWATKSGIAVGTSTSVVNGQFTMDLPAPHDDWFRQDESENGWGGATSSSSSSSGSSGISASADASAGDPDPTGGFGQDASADDPSSDGGINTQSLHPQTNVSGGIVEPLESARAGLVVWTDDNGNGKLDYDGTSGSLNGDTIIGGNLDIELVFFRKGGDLDFEKLRDRSNVKPVAGYNLEVASNNGELWLGLDEVALNLSNDARLPYEICSTATPIESGSDAGLEYVCSADGLHYDYRTCSESTFGTGGLCGGATGIVDNGCSTSPGQTLNPGDAYPQYWPCPIGSVDGGPAVFDAGVDDPSHDASANP